MAATRIEMGSEQFGAKVVAAVTLRRAPPPSIAAMILNRVAE
jgi:hypothetical protein